MKPRKGKSFYLKITLPTLLTIVLFVTSLFLLIVPFVESELLLFKKEMIRELTNSAWSILENQYEQEQKGLLSRAEAQQTAMRTIRQMRYGEARKDYFWIIDTSPKMIMHPYRDDLKNVDLLEYKDSHQKKLFNEFVATARKSGDGFVDYHWQWQDDPSRIVPKVSYLKIFTPWNWIIGTGIYLDDVDKEIRAMSGNIIKISVFITLLISLMLLYITRESLNIERERIKAEKDLKESERKYRTLVESASEGVMMFVAGHLVYSNRPVLEMLGYEDGLSESDLEYIFSLDPDSRQNFQASLTDPAGAFDARLQTADGDFAEIRISPAAITLENQAGVILTLHDISEKKQIEEKLGLSLRRYQSLADDLHIGIFRVDASGNFNFIDANPASTEIFGLKNQDALLSTSLSQLFREASSWEKLRTQLKEDESIRNLALPLARSDGSHTVVSLSMRKAAPDNGLNAYYEGMVEDITEKVKHDQERENLIVELQTSLLFINQPIKAFANPPLTCSLNYTVVQAAALMKKQRQSAILVQTANGDDIGIVTDYDITHRYVAEKMAAETPVYKIMSSPIFSLPDDALVFEAVLLSQAELVRHLFIRDEEGRIDGIIDNQDLLHFHQHSSAMLIQEVKEAESAEELAAAHEKLPRLIKTLVDSGAKADNTTRLISKISDLINEKIIGLAINEMGPPPVRFSFLNLGSGGRLEQTLLTDQDNAIIYEDVAEESAAEVRAYFLALGEKICTDLDRTGYRFCEGEIMAMNQKWCQPLAVWKSYFHQWITAVNDQDLMEIKIFFDFRNLFGAVELAEELRQHIEAEVKKHPLFLIAFARDALLYKPPIDFFGKIIVGSSEKKPEAFNIKDAMKLLLNFARLYALEYNLRETNTLGRVRKLYELGAIKESTFKEATEVFNYLMQSRLRHQAVMMDNDLPPDNLIDPKSLSDIELAMLKRALSHLIEIKAKISAHYKVSA